MQKFLELVKKEMLRQATEEDRQALKVLLQENEELNEFYKVIALDREHAEEKDWLAAEQAYAVHYARMKLNKQVADL